jgi:hypothetical protein
MFEFELGIDEAQVQRALDELGAEVRPELARITLRAGTVLEAAMRREIVSRLAKEPTGFMARNVRTTAVKTGDEIAGAMVGVYTPYAEIQNDGGTIHSKGKLLAVPLRGVPKGKAPRDWGADELHIVPRRGKAPLLADAAGHPKYVLMQSVNIPGVHYAEAASAAAAGPVEQLIAAELEELFARVGG